MSTSDTDTKPHRLKGPIIVFFTLVLCVLGLTQKYWLNNADDSELLTIVDPPQSSYAEPRSWTKEELIEAYDEDVIELWFKKHPEEITKYKPEPKEKKKKKPAAASSSSASSNSAKNKQKNTGKSGIMGAITSAFNSVLGVFTGAGTEL